MNARAPIFYGILLLGVACAIGCGRKSDPEVVYSTSDGKKTKDIQAVAAVDGEVAYQVVDDKPIPDEAQVLHQKARTKGEKGDYDSALQLLEQASRLAPDWAYPRYDMAFTYLLKGQSAKALEKYLEVDRKEPGGFFTTKTAVWCLQKEQKGEFPDGTYLIYLSLEWAEPAKKRAMIEQLTTELPSFTPAWKEKALLTKNDGERSALIRKALSLDADPETHGMLMLNHAALLHQSGQQQEALSIVENLRTNESSTLSTKTMAGEAQKVFKKASR